MLRSGTKDLHRKGIETTKPTSKEFFFSYTTAPSEKMSKQVAGSYWLYKSMSYATTSYETARGTMKKITVALVTVKPLGQDPSVLPCAVGHTKN